jgi:hypothetical protein
MKYGASYHYEIVGGGKIPVEKQGQNPPPMGNKSVEGDEDDKWRIDS